MKSKGGFLSKALGTLATLGLTTGLNFIINLVLARVLGPVGKGIVAPALSAGSVIVILASLGLDHSSAYFLDKKPFRAGNVLLTSFLFSLISGLAAALITLVSLYYLIPETSFLTRTFFSAGIFFTVIYNVSHSTLLGRNRIGLINLARLSADLARTALVVVFLYSVYPSVEGFAFAYMSAQALNALLTTVFAFGEVGTKDAKLDLSFLRKALGFGTAVFLASLTIQANRQVGVLLLKFLRSTEETGIYSMALTLINLLLLVPQALSFALYGAVVGEKGKERFVARTVRLSLFALLILCCATAAAAPWLIPALFTSGFAPSVGFLWGLLPSVIIYALPQLYASFVIAGWGRPWQVFAASILGLSLNAAGNLILIPILGAWGAVISFNASALAMAAYYLILLKKMGRMNMRTVLIPDKEDLGFLFRRLKNLSGRKKG